MTRGARALFAPGLATALACAFLVALGFWQLRRLDQKEALIARIDARIGAKGLRGGADCLQAQWNQRAQSSGRTPGRNRLERNFPGPT